MLLDNEDLLANDNLKQMMSIERKCKFKALKCEIIKKRILLP